MFKRMNKSQFNNPILLLESTCSFANTRSSTTNTSFFIVQDLTFTFSFEFEIRTTQSLD